MRFRFGHFHGFESAVVDGPGVYREPRKQYIFCSAVPTTRHVLLIHYKRLIPGYFESYANHGCCIHWIVDRFDFLVAGWFLSCFGNQLDFFTACQQQSCGILPGGSSPVKVR